MSRLCKKHPIAGWLSMAQPDYRRTFDKLIEERDRLNDPSHSGPAPAYHRWVWREELPELAKIPFYRNQFRDHVATLDERITDLEDRIQRAAGQLQNEAAMWATERLMLLRAMGVELEGD
jgi:hypothetical protein